MKVFHIFFWPAWGCLVLGVGRETLNLVAFSLDIWEFPELRPNCELAGSCLLLGGLLMLGAWILMRAKALANLSDHEALASGRDRIRRTGGLFLSGFLALPLVYHLVLPGLGFIPYAQGWVGSETSAEKGLITLVEAEAEFLQKGYAGSRRFCYDLARLRDQKGPDGKPIRLIDAALASGRKRGYRYGVIPTYDTQGGKDPRFGFAYYAVPLAYGVTGRRTYIINQTGSGPFKDQGNNRPPACWPDISLPEDGWIVLSQ